MTCAITGDITVDITCDITMDITGDSTCDITGVWASSGVWYSAYHIK